MAAGEPCEMIVRMRDVMATPGLVLWCVHLAFNASLKAAILSVRVMLFLRRLFCESFIFRSLVLR